MLRWPEIDHNAGVAAGQAFAGADVERHASPAPVGDFGAQGDKSLGLAVRVNAALLAVRWHRRAADGTRGVLAADHILRQRLGSPGLERAQHLELFVAN